MEEEIKEQTPQPRKSSNSKYLIIVGIIVILVISVFTYGSQNQSKSTKAPATEKTTTSTQTKSLYKDGTYSAEGDYTVHIGEKHIKVTVTLKNDIITDSTVLNEADDPTSVKFQDSFISGYKEFVTGKNINSVHLTKVARSSLTSDGFNKALRAIEEQAKS